MMEELNNQNIAETGPEEETARVFGMLAEKKSLEDGVEKREVSAELKEMNENGKVPELVLEEINEKIQKKIEQYKKDIGEFKERFKNVDAEILASQIKFWEEKLDDYFKEIGLEYIDTYELLYTDEKFNIASYGFLRKEMYKNIDSSFNAKNVKSVNDIDKTAMMFFDLNGLKTVNDFAVNRHESGDKMLEVSADILENGKTKKWLEKLGLKVVPVHRSGDEFMVLISGERPVSLPSEFQGVEGESVKGASITEYALEMIKKEFKEDERFSKILNFGDNEQRKIFEEKGIIKPNEWPKDFEFEGSISGGSASFLDALRNLNIQEDELKNMAWKDVIKKVMGSIINIADRRMSTNKDKEKESDTLQNKILRASGR